jgi:tetratricopeptide (TPR) repeat protein
LEIIAVKDEDSLKVLLPDYWGEKGRVHPAAMYVAGPDASFSAMRTDVSRGQDNPYYDIYEQYTFSILRANYTALPLWARYGVAGFYANTIVEDDRIRVGPVRRAEMNLLQRSILIPINQLFVADQQSPLINDQNSSALFYAESWAIVHYLRMDPGASKQMLLDKYLKSWDETGDALQSATNTFGDLQKFQTQVEHYVHMQVFYEDDRRSGTHLSVADYMTRQMSTAEALILQADFLEHRSKIPEARQLLSRAQQLQPSLPSLHARVGYADFLQFNNDDAEKELEQATSQDPQDFRSLFCLAEIALRKGGYGPQNTPQIISDLEKVVQIAPNFAPGYAFLSVAYRQQPDTRQKSLDAALKSNQLDPATLPYLVDVGDALIALNRDSDARVIGEKLNKAASSPQEKQAAQSFQNRLAHYEQSAPQKSN